MSFLSLILSLSLLAAAQSQSQPQPPKSILINCGAAVSSVIDGRRWLPDAGFVSGGTPRRVTVPGILPILSTVRSFPSGDGGRRKFCYEARVLRGRRYMVRTTYFYGGINGGDLAPPVFDQIVEGTLWSVVNTTEDYARGMMSYYEGVFLATGKTMTVCLAANQYTDSDMFISALEYVILEDSLYNSTDFKKFGLSLVARHSFGYDGPVIRYPDDRFDRFWEPFGESNSAVSAKKIAISNFWNAPPLKIFETELANSQQAPLELPWPFDPLPNSTYYIALYFADSRNSSLGRTRVFSININGVTYYQNLDSLPAGSMVFSKQWPLAGSIKITLTPDKASSIGPVINAGEIFGVLPLEGRTLARDVIALERVKKSLQNAPLDWNGDPCLPRQHSWTGISCSGGSRIRIVALNLTSMSLSGSLSSSIANMTALTNILLGNNSLSGLIPDLSPLKRLQILHLEDNQFRGEIPASLGTLDRLRELFLQGNNLTGQVPRDLTGKAGLNLKTLPGNHLS